MRQHSAGKLVDGCRFADQSELDAHGLEMHLAQLLIFFHLLKAQEFGYPPGQFFDTAEPVADRAVGAFQPIGQL